MKEVEKVKKLRRRVEIAEWEEVEGRKSGSKRGGRKRGRESVDSERKKRKKTSIVHY
jgi:hypothetical protein